MLLNRNAVLVGLLLLFSASSSFSQSRTVRKKSNLLSPEEGKDILQAAWLHRSEVEEQPDCSHLVHEVYALAGYDYEFAPSRELYGGGTAPFRRVLHPQSGDLIVWLGHVGIVVSAKEHSFYSSLNSGLRTVSYATQYWLKRGTPHFYRFVRNKQRPHQEEVRTAHVPQSSDSSSAEE
jgi:NlpC/P60 family